MSPQLADLKVQVTRVVRVLMHTMLVVRGLGGRVVETEVLPNRALMALVTSALR